MSYANGECDGRNCFYKFHNGDTFVYNEDNPDEIYCCDLCMFSVYGEPFRYGTFGERDEE